MLAGRRRLQRATRAGGAGGAAGACSSRCLCWVRALGTIELEAVDGRAYRASEGGRWITFHELRHTFGSAWLGSGVPLRTIQHWMGHSDAKTTQVYAHYQPSDAAADMVDSAFA